MNYRQDEQLTELGEKVRGKCHKERLDGFMVAYLFREEAAKSKGKLQLGKATCPGGVTTFLLEEMFGETVDFLIEIAEDLWKGLSSSQREALLDHELAHCTYKEDKSGTHLPSIRGHDVEEFREVLKRRGVWNADLGGFVAECQQIKLPLEAVG